MAFSLGNFAIRAKETRVTGASTHIDENKYIAFSEQQRGLFVLLESEFEGKKIYDIVEDFVHLSTTRTRFGAPSVNRNEYYKLLNNSLKAKEDDLCFNLIINHKQEEYIDGRDQHFRYYALEFIRSPRHSPNHIEFTKEKYSFFFPEKDFALIKYLPKDCENE